MTVNIGLDFEIAKGQEFRSTNPIRRVDAIEIVVRRDKVMSTSIPNHSSFGAK